MSKKIIEVLFRLFDPEKTRDEQYRSSITVSLNAAVETQGKLLAESVAKHTRKFYETLVMLDEIEGGVYDEQRYAQLSKVWLQTAKADHPILPELRQETVQDNAQPVGPDAPHADQAVFFEVKGFASHLVMANFMHGGLIEVGPMLLTSKRLSKEHKAVRVVIQIADANGFFKDGSGADSKAEES